MKFYSNFNEMFNAQSGLKSDMSIFNRVSVSKDSYIYSVAFEAPGTRCYMTNNPELTKEICTLFGYVTRLGTEGEADYACNGTIKELKSVVEQFLNQNAIEFECVGDWVYDSTYPECRYWYVGSRLLSRDEESQLEQLVNRVLEDV